MSTSFSMAASCLFFRDKAGVLHTCLGIDVQIAQPAPIGKRFGVDVGADDNMPVASVLLLASLGFHKPYVERSGELIAVGHDPKNSLVIFESVPGHA